MRGWALLFLMAVWVDPILPILDTPTWEVLQENPVRFGNYDAILTPNQWEFTFCPEPFPTWVGGVRSAKTYGGIFRSFRHLLWIPDNKGIIGRQYESDLKETAQADFNELAEKTGMVKKILEKKTILYCCEPATGRVLPGKPTSEVLFQHLENPNHLKGHGIGFYWIEEGSEVDKKAKYRLTDRLSHPPARGRYTGMVTSNPEGRNWVWNEAYNPEFTLPLTKAARLMRRGIHNRTKDNPFLTEEYLQMQYATSPPEW